MARTRAVRFAPGAACGGRLAAEDCADRMVVTTRRELSACGPALPRGTGGHPTLLTQRVAKPAEELRSAQNMVWTVSSRRGPQRCAGTAPVLAMLACLLSCTQGVRRRLGGLVAGSAVRALHSELRHVAQAGRLRRIVSAARRAG